VRPGLADLLTAMAAQECCGLALSADLPVLQRLLRGRRRRTRATPALTCSALASLGPRATRTRVRKDQDDVPRRPRPVGRILLALTFTKIMCRSYVPMSFTHAVIRSGLADLLELAFAGGKREREGNEAVEMLRPAHLHQAISSHLPLLGRGRAVRQRLQALRGGGGRATAATYYLPLPRLAPRRPGAFHASSAASVTSRQ
jgi:hypothetical protein